MTKCATSYAPFPRCKGRQVTANFEGVDITSDAPPQQLCALPYSGRIG